MKLNNLIKPMVLSLTCAMAASAGAHSMNKEDAVKDYNFVTVKAGLVAPTPLDGNSGLNTGDATYTGGFSVGRKLEERFAVEFEYMYRGESTARAYNASANPGDNNTYWSAKSNTFMANLSADLLTDCKIIPYAKVGLGMSSNKANDYVYNNTEILNTGTSLTTTNTYKGKTSNEFAWQVGAGFNMKTTDMFDTQIQYMFTDRGRIKTEANYSTSGGTTMNNDARTGKLKDHVVTIGLTTRF